MSLNDRTYAAGNVLTPAGVQVSAAARKVLRNTYLLLGMTLAFSAVIAGLSAAMGWPHPGLILTLVGYFGLLFAIARLRDSALGVALVFALTGFMGYTLGPILGAYLKLPHGGDIVMMAMGGTAVVFFVMSAIALNTKRDLSFLGNFLLVGMIVAFLAGLAAVFFQLPLLALVVSAAVVLLMSGMILYETQAILQGGETNYVMATVSLYVSLYNLFTSLLQLIGAFSGDD
jgi:modulator of FtsH protease